MASTDPGPRCANEASAGQGIDQGRQRVQVTGSAVASSTTTNDPASDDTAREWARVPRPAAMAHPCSPAANMTRANATSFPASMRPYPGSARDATVTPLCRARATPVATCSGIRTATVATGVALARHKGVTVASLAEPGYGCMLAGKLVAFALVMLAAGLHGWAIAAGRGTLAHSLAMSSLAGSFVVVLLATALPVT